MTDKAVIVFLLLIFICLPHSSFSQQQRFDEGTHLLEEQQVEEAYEIYRSIESENYRSGKLYYNMGLSAVYMDSLGLAKYYFMQAQTYEDVKNDAESAIEYVDNRFNRRSAVLPELPWERLLSWLSEAYGATGVMAGGLILFNIGIAVVISSWFVTQFTTRFSEWLRKSGYAGIGLALLLLLTSLLINHLDSRYKTGVLVQREAVVREQPLDEASTINTAYEGYVIRVDLKQSEGEPEWFHVRLENGMYGWIPRSGVRVF